MDHTQGLGYLQLIKDINMELNPHLQEMFDKIPNLHANANKFGFVYWVFGYDKEPLENQEKFVEVEETPLKVKEFYESVRKYVSTIEMYMAMDDVPTNPIYDLCKDCPVNKSNGGYCTAFSNVHKV
jgi:hypothetical protein